MDRIVLAGRLVDIAGDLAALAGDKGASEVLPQSPFNAFEAYRGVREAQSILAEKLYGKTMKADDRTKIEKLPGFSPMQLRQQINRIVEARQKAKQIRLQFEAVLKDLKDLEDDEKAGLAKLRDAAEQVKEKEKFLVEAENGLLEFTAYVQRKRPGVEQMLADPTSSKFGDKAGDFFGRIGAKLGKKVQAAVEAIYSQTEEDLTHMADCVTGLKVVEKTVSVQASTLKKAGLADAIISIRDWLAGKTPDSLVSRIINFTGDIARFVRGFAERTGLVKSATKDLTDALDEATDELDQALAKS